MTQVLCVSRFSGSYEFLDKEGRVIDTEHSSGLISSEDADVLIERIRQGYQYVVPGCYILRLEGVGLYDTGYFEFTELITFDSDDDGYPIPRHTQLVTQDTFDSPYMDHNRILTSNAFIDYTEKTVKWMGNALAADPYVYDPADAIRVCDVDDDVAILLSVGARFLMKGKSTRCSLIPTRFYLE